MKRGLLVSGAVALCAMSGSALGFFDVADVAVVGNASLTPSSGSFVTQLAEPDLENFYLKGALPGGGQFLVRNDFPTWNADRDGVMSSTWLAIDPFGPKGADGTASYGTGWQGTAHGPGGAITSAPRWSDGIASANAGLAANGFLGDPVNGDGLSPGFFADVAGFAWNAPVEESYNATSAPTVINGEVLDSLFIGHFVLTDPNAVIVGPDLLAAFRFESPGPEASQQIRVPLDGSLAEFDFRIVTERTTFTNAMGTFTAIDMYLVPSPVSVAPLLGMVCGLARRRR